MASAKGLTKGEVAFVKAFQKAAGAGVTVEDFAAAQRMEVNSVRAKLSGIRKVWRDSTGKELPLPDMKGLNTGGRRGARSERISIDDVAEMLGVALEGEQTEGETEGDTQAAPAQRKAS